MRDITSRAALALLLLVPVQIFAATRTTPVEVKNAPNVSVTNVPTVKLDATQNLAQSQQYGPWNVGITGTPTVSVTNTPNVNVSNSPTVKIDAATNLVTTQTKSSTVVLWSTDQLVATNTWLWSPNIDCKGFKEIRFAINANSTSANLTVAYRCQVGIYTMGIGHANFAAPANGISREGNYTTSSGWCIFTVPVMSDKCDIAILNSTGTAVTVSKLSWAYLVN